MPKIFAKVFEFERSQLVALCQNNDDGNPELRFFFHPGISELDVCSWAYAFTDEDRTEDEAIAARDAAFTALDADKLRQQLDKHIDTVRALVTPNVPSASAH